MRKHRAEALALSSLVAVVVVAGAGSCSRRAPVAAAWSAAIACESCDEWNAPQEPFRIFGNTYYVGVAGLSAVLIASRDGLVLLDGALPQSAPLIDANIRKLGYRTEDVRLIVSSHAHYDHAGGIAALQQRSAARVAASGPGAWALQHGHPPPDDPQHESGRDPRYRFPRVPHVEVVTDGQALTVGDVTLTAHLTPGHTPGSTTWTWRACEGTRCLHVVYADSVAPVSDDGFRFTGDATRKSLIPTLQRSIEKIGQLPCDILIPVHPSFSAADSVLAARAAGRAIDALITGHACRDYATAAATRLATRIAAEQ